MSRADGRRHRAAEARKADRQRLRADRKQAKRGKKATAAKAPEAGTETGSR